MPLSERSAVMFADTLTSRSESAWHNVVMASCAQAKGLLHKQADRYDVRYIGVELCQGCDVIRDGISAVCA